MHANHPFYRTSYSGCSVSVKVGGIVAALFLVVVALLVGIVVVITKVAKKAKTSKEDASRNNLLYN